MKSYAIKEWESKANERIRFEAFRLREGRVMQASGFYNRDKVVWDCGGICYHNPSMKRCKKGDIDF